MGKEKGEGTPGEVGGRCGVISFDIQMKFISEQIINADLIFFHTWINNISLFSLVKH